MNYNPLSYNISNWFQAAKCLSNNSKHLKISVSNIQYDRKLQGTLISVVHDMLGTLFSALIYAHGTMLTEDSLNHYHQFSDEDILKELRKFGFNITFTRRANLSGDQLSYLITLDSLGFDKIRVLDVISDDGKGIKQSDPTVVVFRVDDNPMWINNNYACTEEEFKRALVFGSAINISGISMTESFDWGWLDYVANIKDILRDNIGGTGCG